MILGNNMRCDVAVYSAHTEHEVYQGKAQISFHPKYFSTSFYLRHVVLCWVDAVCGILNILCEVGSSAFTSKKFSQRLPCKIRAKTFFRENSPSALAKFVLSFLCLWRLNSWNLTAREINSGTRNVICKQCAEMQEVKIFGKFLSAVHGTRQGERGKYVQRFLLPCNSILYRSNEVGGRHSP